MNFERHLSNGLFFRLAKFLFRSHFFSNDRRHKQTIVTNSIQNSMSFNVLSKFSMMIWTYYFLFLETQNSTLWLNIFQSFTMIINHQRRIQILNCILSEYIMQLNITNMHRFSIEKALGTCQNSLQSFSAS